MSENTAVPEANAQLGAAAKRAVVYVLGGFGASTLLRLLGNLALTRLLLPEAFGMMSLIMAMLVGLHLFSDLGIRPSIVQSDRGDDPLYLDTAWTIQIGRGLLLWLAALCLAHPFALLYEEPRLASLLMGAGLSPLITGFMSTKLYSADRHLDQRKLATVELTAQFTGLVTMLLLALLYRNAWSLVTGSLVTDVTKVSLSHLYLKGANNRLRFDRDSASKLMRFGRWIFLSTLLTFFVSQSDRLVFGLLVPLSSLGFYQAGAGVAALVPLVLNGVAGRVIFPVYSQLIQRGEELGPAFARVRRPLLVAGGWALSGLVAGGPAAVSLLYPDDYFPAGWILQLLATGAWFSLLASPYWQGLLAKGMSTWMAGSSSAKVVAMAIFIPLGYSTLGFQGAVAGYAAADLGIYIVSLIGGRRIGLSAAGEDLALTARFGVAALVGNLAMRAAGDVADVSIVKALATFVSVSLVWLPAIWGLRGLLRSTPLSSPSRGLPLEGAH